MNAYTFDLGDEIFIAAACPYQPQGRWHHDFRQRLCDAGVEELRCAPNPLSLTSYPTRPQSISELRAIHTAIRTGDFGKASVCAPSVVIFGLITSKPVYDWLAARKPGEPLEDIIRYLTWLAQRDRTKHVVMEAQLDASVSERVFADLGHKLITDDSVPEVLRDSQYTAFNLPTRCVYITHDDWRRIIENGKRDVMQRGATRKDVWRCWFHASAALKPSWATTLRPQG
jgi:hypothetical protein